MTSINLAVEGDIDGVVLGHLVATRATHLNINKVYVAGNDSKLRAKIPSYRQASVQIPFVILTDLDSADCAPTLLSEIVPGGGHPNLVVRVAVRKLEAWLLADPRNLSSYLQVRASDVPADPEALFNPKQALVDLARKSRSRDIVSDMVPDDGGTAKVGRNYNGRLSKFVRHNWDVEAAREAADSLDRALRALSTFHPQVAAG